MPTDPKARRTAELVSAVKKHALENYDRDGWDYIVECWSDADIAEQIGNAYSEGGAIRRVGAIAKLLDDRRKDIQATAW
jgi:hypothetical protein